LKGFKVCSQVDVLIVVLVLLCLTQQRVLVSEIELVFLIVEAELKLSNVLLVIEVEFEGDVFEDLLLLLDLLHCRILVVLFKTLLRTLADRRLLQLIDPTERRVRALLVH